MSQSLIEKILSHTATPVEKQQFEEWLNASEDNRRYFNKTKIVWNSLDNAFSTKKFDKKSAQVKIESKINAGRKTLQLKPHRKIAFAATLLLLIGLSFFIGNKALQNNQFKQIYAAGNTILEVTLNDGSHIWLNKRSTLKVPEKFSDKDREVILTGEAYFEIARDEAKPFKIMAGKTVTKVLGTSFNIEMDTLKGDVTIDVKSGKVAFYQKHWFNNEYYLTVGAYARYLESEDKILVGKNESMNYLSWKTGKLEFYDTPISRVCKDLSKFYGVNISTELNDSTILTGTFDHERSDDVMSIIKLSLGLEIEENNGIYLFVKQQTN